MDLKQLAQLKADHKSGNLAHAYLFVGQSGSSKFEVAREFADFLQDGAIRSLDTTEIADNGESIKTSEVREMLKRVNLTSQAEYKMILIENVERMTLSAANSFLKTLEEPPERTIFILTTPSLSLVLPTIISRTRVMRFHSVVEPLADAVEMKEVMRLIERPDVVDRFEYVENILEDSARVARFLDCLLVFFRD